MWSRTVPRVVPVLEAWWFAIVRLRIGHGTSMKLLEGKKETRPVSCAHRATMFSTI